MNKEQLLDYIEKQLIEITYYIKNRAETYDENITGKEDFLFDVAADKGIIAKFDWEDLCNHNFDLGSYWALMNLLTKIK